MPTAVITESSEKTMSSSMIWTITLPNDAAALPRGRRAAALRACRESRYVLFASRNRPPPIRIRSRARDVVADIDVNERRVSLTIQASENSSTMRMSIARQQADPPRPLLLRGRQLARQNRDEDDVVDAEHDLEERQRDEGDDELSHGPRPGTLQMRASVHSTLQPHSVARAPAPLHDRADVRIPLEPSSLGGAM